VPAKAHGIGPCYWVAGGSRSLAIAVPPDAFAAHLRPRRRLAILGQFADERGRASLSKVNLFRGWELSYATVRHRLVFGSLNRVPGIRIRERGGRFQAAGQRRLAD
jgi:hypothetical protein